MVNLLRVLFLFILLFSILNCGQKFTVIKAYQRTNAESRYSTLELDVLAAKSIGEYRRGELDSARAGFLSVLTAEKPNWEAFYYLGLIQRDEGDFKAAIRRYDSALDHSTSSNSKRSALYYSLGECYEQLHNFSRSQQYYIAALKLNPELVAASEGLERIGKLRAQKE